MKRLSIQVHPLIQFIEVSNVDEGEWTFSLDGIANLGSYGSQAEAIEAAEQLFFRFSAEKSNALIRQALDAGQVEQALKIAERRGFWSGQQARQTECAQTVTQALQLLAPLIEPRYLA